LPIDASAAPGSAVAVVAIAVGIVRADAASRRTPVQTAARKVRMVSLLGDDGGRDIRDKYSIIAIL
jgi:hypothetical protein